jgi:starvation-inducible DNA-binding protein
MTTTTSTPSTPTTDVTRVTDALQHLLDSALDLSLTLKHVHWNLVGADFISAHTMLDPQVEAVRDMGDDLGERIAALGVAPDGRLASVAGRLSHYGYPFGRRTVADHFARLAEVYEQVIDRYRQAIDIVDAEPVSQDLVIGQARQLEKFQWLVRAHLEQPDGQEA